MSRSQSPLAAHVTGRGIFIGCVLCAVIAIGAPYGTPANPRHFAGPDFGHPRLRFSCFSYCLLTLHLILGWCRRGWALQRGELITIFTMMMVAAAIPTKGVNGLLIAHDYGHLLLRDPRKRLGQPNPSVATQLDLGSQPRSG